jgi:hypothetical protein
MVARTIKITGKLDFVCPFCPGRVTVGEVAGSPSDMSESVRELDSTERALLPTEPVALHSMPFCPQFNTMDLIAFVRACRIKGVRPLS